MAVVCPTLLAEIVAAALPSLTWSPSTEQPAVGKVLPWEVTGQILLKGKVLESRQRIFLGELLTIMGQ